MVKRNRDLKKVMLLIAVTLVVVFLSSYFVFIKQSVKHQPQPASTISELPAHPASNNGDKVINGSSGINQGSARDNNGASTSTTDSSKWVASNSGVITVKSPIENETLQSGFNLSGTAKTDKVQFRLIDNSTGVISQGFINVVSGNFSADVNFKPTGNSGRLDVFNTNDAGVEINEVQLQVKF